MDAQKFTLLISLASSVAVVLISSAASIWSKRIDTQQKKQDRNLEFNKLYATRKIDAGEAAIGRSNLIIVQARLQRQLLNAYVTNYGYYQHQGASKLDEAIEKTNTLLLTDKSSYRLYFDVTNSNKRIAEASLKCDQLMSKILGGLDAKRRLVHSVSDKDVIMVEEKDKREWAIIQKTLEELLDKYNYENDIWQQFLLEDCSYFRQELAKYDIAS